MKKSILISLLFLFFISYVDAQTSIKGKIIDTNGNPIAFATLNIQSTTETSIGIIEKVSDENGLFEIYLPSNGTYTIISYYGNYSEAKQQFDFNMPEDSITLTVPKEENQNIELKEVIVKKSKALIERKLDRIVMNVSDNSITTGKTSMDLFLLAPGVFFNNGNISINGVWGARVMVDGKMLNLSGDDLRNYLQTLRSNDIQSIEIIAHPSAEFDAEGSGGIINIILKSSSKQGFNGYIGNDYSIGLGKYPTYNPYVSLNYKNGKFGINANYSYNNSKNYEELEQKRDFVDKGIYRQNTNNVMKSKSHRIKFDLTYDISEKQFLGISYIGQFNNSSNNSISNSSIVYLDNAKNVKSTGRFPTDSDSKYHNIGLNYTIKTDSLGSKFSFISDFTHNNRNGSSTSDSKDFNDINTIIRDTLFKLYYPSEAKIVTADSKYNWILKNRQNLTFGAKITSTEINNTNHYEVFNDIWNSIPSLDFQFDYKEKIYAGYVNFSGKWKNIDYQLGLRGEQSNVEGYLWGNQKATINQNYFNWFPTLFLKKNLNEKGSNYLSFSYNRRIKRPSYFDLNPYKYFIDNYSILTGNPYLKPQFTNSFELSSLWNGKYYTSFSYSETKDAIAQIIQNNSSEGLLTIIKDNTGTNKVFTTTLSAPISITKWWSTTNNLLLTYTISESEYFKIKKPSFIFQTQHEILLGNGFSANLNGFYTPQMVSGNIVTKSIAGVDIGLQKKFFENKITAKASVSDVFYTNNYKATSYFNDTKIAISHKEQSRTFSFSLIYNFKIGEKFTTKKIDSSSLDEKDRL
ncbi:outer membrane beta-barrel family protein [Chishuiella sp.]|uniref:outer membrane beta-barrel family protein n=1 Tax=Chishuiella sp. TaxID=1969467 RepID=UPI0028ADC6CD|nr:outer membrane beta-barrel family protein [Chishuiella sp.]